MVGRTKSTGTTLANALVTTAIERENATYGLKSTSRPEIFRVLARQIARTEDNRGRLTSRQEAIRTEVQESARNPSPSEDYVNREISWSLRSNVFGGRLNQPTQQRSASQEAMAFDDDELRLWQSGRASAIYAGRPQTELTHYIEAALQKRTIMKAINAHAASTSK